MSQLKNNPGGEENYPPVQTGPGAHPASCKMGTGSFPGVKCGRGVMLTSNTSPPNSAEVKETMQLYVYSPSVLMGKVHRCTGTEALYRLYGP